MDFSKTKVAVAAANHSKLDVSSTHITTGNFMTLMPAYYRHMIPGEHIKGSGSVLTRMASVAVPTYGRCRINMRAFFVPFRTVMPKWNEFITDAIGVNYSNASLVSGTPIVSNQTIYTMFVTGSFIGNTLTRQLNSSDTADQAIITAGTYDFHTSAAYYVFTAAGRRLYKLLRSLGYGVIWDDKVTWNWSALPLLCMAKLYLDWYANSAYLNNTIYTKVQQLLEYNQPNNQLVLSSNQLQDIMELLYYVSYDSSNDVYLNAWDNPMSPNNGLSTNFSMVDTSFIIDPNSQSYNYVEMSGSSANYNTPMMKQSLAASTFVGSEYIHNVLKSMTDYVKRNQLSGAYAVDRFLARFGLNLDSAKVNRSIYVGASSIDVDFGTVMQTVNTATGTDPSNLGDYAGQGLGRGNLDFDFKCDEFGMFLITYTIIPAAHFYQGYDRNNRHLTKDQFYTPEYDNLGCAVIEKGEVYLSKENSFGTTYNSTYGFAPRYYEYKQKTDFVTGDFVHPSVFAGGDSWHLQRELVDGNFSGSISNLTHSFAMTQGVDRGQYDRIFNYTNTDIDKFYLVFNFAAQSLAPCKSLFDSYDFEEVANKITMNGGSAKVN